MPGACNQDGAIYEAKVTTDDGRVESYMGLAKNFKNSQSTRPCWVAEPWTDRQHCPSMYGKRGMRASIQVSPGNI